MKGRLKLTVYISVSAYMSMKAPHYTVHAGCSCLALTCIPAIHSLPNMYCSRCITKCSCQAALKNIFSIVNAKLKS